jgi:transposase
MNQSTQRIIRNKIGLLNLAEELGNVSKACQMMGVSRDTFYRYQAAREDGVVEALLEKSRRKPNPKNRVEPQIEQVVLDFALEYPAHGQVRISIELRKQGVFVSPSGVRGSWLRSKLPN